MAFFLSNLKNPSSENFLFSNISVFLLSLFSFLLNLYTTTKDFPLTFHIVLFFISQNKEESSFFFTRYQYKPWTLLSLTLPTDTTHPSLCYERWFRRSKVNLHIHSKFLIIGTQQPTVYSKPLFNIINPSEQIFWRRCRGGTVSNSL